MTSMTSMTSWIAMRFWDGYPGWAHECPAHRGWPGLGGSPRPVLSIVCRWFLGVDTAVADSTCPCLTGTFLPYTPWG